MKHNKHVIHAVGPNYFEHTPEICELLMTSVVIIILDYANLLKSESVAIPAISSGIFGFPVERVAAIM